LLFLIFAVDFVLSSVLSALLELCALEFKSQPDISVALPAMSTLSIVRRIPTLFSDSQIDTLKDWFASNYLEAQAEALRPLQAMILYQPELIPRLTDEKVINGAISLMESSWALYSGFLFDLALDGF
jgi:hypothetical protein